MTFTRRVSGFSDVAHHRTASLTGSVGVLAALLLGACGSGGGEKAPTDANAQDDVGSDHGRHLDH
jgi:hypothetical protein